MAMDVGPLAPQRAGEQSRDARPSIEMTRQAIAVVGLMSVVYAEAAPGGFAPQGVVAELGVAALVIAALLALVEPSAVATDSCGGRSHRLRHSFVPQEPDATRTIAPQATRAWRWTLLGLGCFGILVAQTWFQSGTAIAGGDLTPPVGTAWIGRVFSLRLVGRQPGRTWTGAGPTPMGCGRLARSSHRRLGGRSAAYLAVGARGSHPRRSGGARSRTWLGTARWRCSRRALLFQPTHPE